MSVAVELPPSPHVSADTIVKLLQNISPSRLAFFQSCRLRFFFRHVLKLRRAKTAALHLGVSVHATLRAWNRARWRQELASVTAMYAFYEAVWKDGQVEEPVGWDSPADEVDQKQTGWRLLETFFRETTIPAADKPEGVEVSVEADLSAHGLPTLIGVLDLVQAGRIIDFKTAGQTPSAERAAIVHSTQLTAYALLYRENAGQQERGIELHHLVKLKQPKLVVIAQPPATEKQASRLFRVIESYVSSIERRDFIPSPGLQCASCEFQNECAAWP